mgnify:CR=1 FL=1
MQVKIRPMSKLRHKYNGAMSCHAVDEQRSGRLIQVKKTLEQLEYDSVGTGIDPFVPVL